LCPTRPHFTRNGADLLGERTEPLRQHGDFRCGLIVQDHHQSSCVLVTDA
jgi:hypothetical protein